MKNLMYLKMYRLFKKIFDLLFAVFVIVLLLPIWFVIAVAIRLDSNGPVIFRQRRVGKDGKIFTMFKFRTMDVSSTPYMRKPLSSADPQITRVGKLLRNTGWDELPQFINVLLGDMSIIGPRPEMPFIADSYATREKLRLKVTPGITGLWQILGPKGEPIHHHLKYDLLYIKHQGFKVDYWIFIQTVKTMLGRKISITHEKKKSCPDHRSDDRRHQNAPQAVDHLFRQD